MKELKNTHYQNLETRLQSAWGDSVLVRNSERIGSNNLHLLFTLCPLYAPGGLENSSLLKRGQIVDSRVANKWKALQVITNELANVVAQQQGNMHMTVVFADKAVLLGDYPGDDDFLALEHQKQIYEQALAAHSSAVRATFEFTTFSSLGVNIPTFINPRAALPEDFHELHNTTRDEACMIRCLNNFLEAQGLNDKITINKKNRGRIRRIMNMWSDHNGVLRLGGFESAFWLTAGYLPFDRMIPELLDRQQGMSGVYLVTERYEPLFSIANLTENLSGRPRIDIKA